TAMFFGRDDGRGLAFVGRQLTHQTYDDGDVVDGGQANHRSGLPALCAQDCFVSQKILSISAIFCSSFSASPGSTVPLPPAAPASFVASLSSWCSWGCFSKGGGLQ